MRLREFAPSPERDHNDDVPDPIFVLANRWWNATDRQPQIEHVLNSLGWSIHQVESEDDGVQLQHRDGTTYFISADDFDPDLFEIKDQPRQNLDFDSLYGKAFKITDNNGNPNNPGFSIVTPLNGASWNWKERPEFKNIVKRKLNDPGFLGDHKYQQIVDTMSGNKFDPEKHLVKEIARIPQSELGGWGDKDTLEPMPKPPKGRKPLPGGSGYTYAVNRDDPEFMEIMIFDGDTLAAELDLFATLDPLKTWRVETVITDPDYRGQGLGKALYGIALSILKLTIEAGETQTKFGQAMWLMLDSIPGVEVLGYAMDRTNEYRARPGDRIVDQNDTWTRYTFPVEPGKRSMRSTRPGTGIYSSQHVSMIAKWTGQ